MTNLEALTSSTLKRFWIKVRKTDGCWEWLASASKAGYGQFGLNRRVRKAHQVSWLIHYGEIPDGLWVLHTCDNPSCVRPDHLYLGTVIENNADRLRRGHYKTGDDSPFAVLARGESNPSAKLKEQDIRDIRAKFAAGAAKRALAREYGIDPTGIRRIVSRTTWRHVA